MRLLTLLVATIGLALAADPFIGTWKLDTSRSNAPSSISDTLIVEAEGSDGFKLIREISREGKPVRKIVGSLKFDGKAYPFTGLAPTETMVSARRINANTWEITNRREGVVTEKFTQTLADDGKTFSLKMLPIEGRTTPPMPDATYVKQ